MMSEIVRRFAGRKNSPGNVALPKLEASIKGLEPKAVTQP